jgi:hypothetical protein
VSEPGKGYTHYTWIVTRDTILGDSSEAVGKIGPSGAANRAPFDSVIIHGEHFRMLNDAGEAQFSGYILGNYRGHEPLDDYGRMGVPGRFPTPRPHLQTLNESSAKNSGQKNSGTVYLLPRGAIGILSLNFSVLNSWRLICCRGRS